MSESCYCLCYSLIVFQACGTSTSSGAPPRSSTSEILIHFSIKIDLFFSELSFILNIPAPRTSAAVTSTPLHRRESSSIERYFYVFNWPYSSSLKFLFRQRSATSNWSLIFPHQIGLWYFQAINELSADSALQSKTQAVVVQRVFDDLTEPLKRVRDDIQIS